MSEITRATPAPFEFSVGDTPLLVSMPHSGLCLTKAVEQGIRTDARALPDTDWYMPELYSFLDELSVAHISANYSRYVIDLNRPLDDAPLYASKTTGLFPEILFDGAPVFSEGCEPSKRHRQWCKDNIWRPYHEKISLELAHKVERFGYAILFDAHSIAPRVPMLFEGQLPDFNLGSNDGHSCAGNFLPKLESLVDETSYSFVSNGRFKGGYITRSFGQPEKHIHSIQLELSQATYMRENLHSFEIDENKLGKIQALLKTLIQTLVGTKPETSI